MQSFINWEFDIETAKTFKLQSISTSRYVIHKGSRAERLLQQNKLNKCNMNFEEINQLEKWTYKFFIKEGYIETRTGNFFLPNHEQVYCKLTYSLGYSLIGFGVGAYSFINNYFIESTNSTNTYQKLIDSGDFLAMHKISNRADKKRLMERFIIMNLMSAVIDRNLFKKRFNTDVFKEFNETFRNLFNYGYIIIDDNFISLTEDGKKWKKNIMSEFYFFKQLKL